MRFVVNSGNTYIHSRLIRARNCVRACSLHAREQRIWCLLDKCCCCCCAHSALKRITAHSVRMCMRLGPLLLLLLLLLFVAQVALLALVAEVAVGGLLSLLLKAIMVSFSLPSSALFVSSSPPSAISSSSRPPPSFPHAPKLLSPSPLLFLDLPCQFEKLRLNLRPR